MSARVTREVLEGYVNCKLKGHLKLVGESGVRSDYDSLLRERKAEGAAAGGADYL